MGIKTSAWTYRLATAIVLSFLSLSSAMGAGEGWRLDRAATMLDKGQKVSLNIKGEAPGSLKWVSDNKKVARVGRNGVVKARRDGDALITAICEETGETASCLVSVGYEAQNPILPPTWDLFIADGEPHVFDGRMYIFGSRDYYDGLDRQGWSDWCSENYHVIWSDDLVHWTDAGEALDIKDIPMGIKGDGKKRLWAPDVFRDPVTGKYHMTACTNNSDVFILDSDAPEGPYTNPRTITLGGKSMGRETDPGVLVDDDGKVYIALPTFIIGQLDPDGYSTILPGTVLDMNPSLPTDNEPFEGPSLRKRGDTYYYIYIQNHGKKSVMAAPTRMAYLTSKDPLGPYEYQGLIVSNHDYPNSGNIHGSFEEFGGKWYVQYHKAIPGLRCTRVPNLEPMEFDEGGLIPKVLMSTSGVRGAFRPGDRVQAGGAVEYSTGRDGSLVKLRAVESNGFSSLRMTGYPYVSFSETGQWACYRWFDMTRKAKKLEARVRSNGPGGVLEFRKGSPDGEVLATVEVPSTKGKWKTVKAPVRVSGSAKETIFAITAKVPANSVLELDYFTIN